MMQEPFRLAEKVAHSFHLWAKLILVIFLLWGLTEQRKFICEIHLGWRLRRLLLKEFSWRRHKVVWGNNAFENAHAATIITHASTTDALPLAFDSVQHLLVVLAEDGMVEEVFIFLDGDFPESVLVKLKIELDLIKIFDM
jgi:hypothetical protein